MLTVNYKDKQYKMYWSYSFDDEVKVTQKQNTTIVKTTRVRYTSIIIQSSDNDIYSATVRCNPQDNFSRETGRLLTLDKVTENLNSEFKELIYKTYHNR